MGRLPGPTQPSRVLYLQLSCFLSEYTLKFWLWDVSLCSSQRRRMRPRQPSPRSFQATRPRSRHTTGTPLSTIRMHPIIFETLHTYSAPNLQDHFGAGRAGPSRHVSTSGLSGYILHRVSCTDVHCFIEFSDSRFITICTCGRGQSVLRWSSTISQPLTIRPIRASWGASQCRQESIGSGHPQRHTGLGNGL